MNNLDQLKFLHPDRLMDRANGAPLRLYYIIRWLLSRLPIRPYFDSQVCQFPTLEDSKCASNL